MTLKTDDDGLESLPLRLMIVAVVAGLSIAPAAGALQALEDRSFLHRCEIQLETLVSASQAVLMEGLGAKRTVDLDLISDGGLRVTLVEIGDEWGGPYMASVAFELSSGRRLIRTAVEPPVWLASDGLRQLATDSNVFSLALSWDIHDGRQMVRCEVLPWTS